MTECRLCAPALPARTASHDRILRAIESVIADERVRTPDLGGKATTEDMTRAVTTALTQGQPV